MAFVGRDVLLKHAIAMLGFAWQGLFGTELAAPVVLALPLIFKLPPIIQYALGPYKIIAGRNEIFHVCLNIGMKAIPASIIIIIISIIIRWVVSCTLAEMLFHEHLTCHPLTM